MSASFIELTGCVCSY